MRPFLDGRVSGGRITKAVRKAGHEVWAADEEKIKLALILPKGLHFKRYSLACSALSLVGAEYHAQRAPGVIGPLW
jgi:hypothetical protein